MLNIALIGYGKMGKTIEALGQEKIPKVKPRSTISLDH